MAKILILSIVALTIVGSLAISPFAGFGIAPIYPGIPMGKGYVKGKFFIPYDIFIFKLIFTVISHWSCTS